MLSQGPLLLVLLFLVIGSVSSVYTTFASVGTTSTSLRSSRPAAGPIRLPVTSGAYPTGVTTLSWSDADRPETIDGAATGGRQFAVSLFYPAHSVDCAARPYFPEIRTFDAALEVTGQPAPRNVDQLVSQFSEVEMSSCADVPPAKLEAGYPLVLLSTGGSMSRHWYTALAEEITSHGYIVAVVSHAYSGLDVYPKGGLIGKHSYYDESVPERNAQLTQRLREDVTTVTNRLLEFGRKGSNHLLEGGIDTARLAVIGHSRGARAVNQLLAHDERFKGGVRLDGLGGADRGLVLLQPHMTLRGHWERKDRLRALDKLHRGTTSRSYDVAMEGVSHFSFTDLALIAPDRFAGDLPPTEAHRRVSKLILLFLDHQLSVQGRQMNMLDSIQLQGGVTGVAYTPH